MEFNKISKAMLGMGMLAVAGSACALEAWNGQEGGDTIQVIFDGSVYQNAWWVGATNCPVTPDAPEGSNPWNYVRDATPAEITQYGNPTSCDIPGSDTPTYPAFSADKVYQEGDIVSASETNYQATTTIPANSFAPDVRNPWQAYIPAKPWNAETVYNEGDVVTVGSQSYEALFYTVGKDPADVANQNPDGVNGAPWKPLDASTRYTDEELAAAPVFDASKLYAANTLVRFQNQPYVSQAKVQKVSPTDINTWKAIVDWTGTKDRVGTAKSDWPAHVYAPYVDFTLNDIPDLAKLATEQGINHFTMAFVVAKDTDTCMPTWGTAYNLQNYAQYSKIKALREAGGDVMVSIGGANNAPLAAACHNIDDLKQMYVDIVENLNLKVLDFDIEGGYLADSAIVQRRNTAVKAAQDQWKKDGKKIAVWYTLPVLPTGLTAEGMYVLNDAKAKGIELAGINIMTMDYGNSICQSTGTEGQNIHGHCATSAIDNMFLQLKGIYTDKTDAQINAMMGTTPMIGYNDVQGETFYLSDANIVMEQAKERNLGMIGIWSMVRDQPGPAGVVEATHSGLTEEQAPKYAFSKVLSQFAQPDAPDDTCCHQWEENGHYGERGNIYVYDNPYNHQTEYFSAAKTGQYWYFPTNKTNNADWIYLGTDKETAKTNNESLMGYAQWGENDRKASLGTTFIYSNPYNGRLELFTLKATGNDGRYWYFPTNKTDNTYWKYEGEVAFK